MKIRAWHLFIRCSWGNLRAWPLFPSFPLFPFFALMIYAASASAIETGDSCENIKALPVGMICWEGTVYECDNGNLRRIESALCSDQELKREDKKLNAAYQRILKELGKPGDETAIYDRTRQKKELTEAQRAWVRFRTTDCALEGTLTQGSWADVFTVDCETRMTKERTKILEERFRFLRRE